MSNKQFTISASDRTDSGSFVVPGKDDGYGLDYGDNYGVSSDGFVTESSTLKNRRDWYIHIDNGFDVDIECTIEGSHVYDLSLSHEVSDGSPITVGTNSVDFVDGTTGHSSLQVSVNPSSTPNSGDLTVTFQSRRA